MVKIKNMTDELNKEFNDLVIHLPNLLEELLNSDLRPWNALDNIPESGVYVFFENGRPIYVGRSNRMRSRLKEHGRQSSTHNSAPFAFNIAKKEAKRKGIEVNIHRGELEKIQAFAELFSHAKDRVSKMSVRVIPIDNPLLQTLFEVYASLSLKTNEYNDFDTH